MTSVRGGDDVVGNEVNLGKMAEGKKAILFVSCRHCRPTWHPSEV